MTLKSGNSLLYSINQSRVSNLGVNELMMTIIVHISRPLGKTTCKIVSNSSYSLVTEPTTYNKTSMPDLDFESLASGWILRLETWDLVNRKRRDDTKDLLLDPAQVEPQLRKSVCHDTFWDKHK